MQNLCCTFILSLPLLICSMLFLSCIWWDSSGFTPLSWPSLAIKTSYPQYQAISHSSSLIPTQPLTPIILPPTTFLHNHHPFTLPSTHHTINYLTLPHGTRQQHHQLPTLLVVKLSATYLCASQTTRSQQSSHPPTLPPIPKQTIKKPVQITQAKLVLHRQNKSSQ